MARKSLVTEGKTARGPGGGFASKAPAPKLFLYGIAGLLLSLAIVFGFPQLYPAQVAVVAALLGLSGAAITTAISGILKIRTKTLVASGPLAVFVLLFWTEMSAGAPGVLPNLTFWRERR